MSTGIKVFAPLWVSSCLGFIITLELNEIIKPIFISDKDEIQKNSFQKIILYIKGQLPPILLAETRIATVYEGHVDRYFLEKTTISELQRSKINTKNPETLKEETWQFMSFKIPAMDW